MVNPGVTSDAEGAATRALILAHTRAARRPALAALLALDDTLANILRTTREPMVGQMRLTWWHDALTALDTHPPPAQPVLQGLAQTVLPRGVAGAALATLVEGWEVLLEDGALPPDALALYAERRGAGLFTLAGRLLGAGPADPLADAGRGWALADLARHSAADSAAALAAAGPAFAVVRAARWSRPARPLGMMARLAALPADASPARRALTVLRHRLTGR